MNIAMTMAEHRWLPDSIVRYGIRQLLRRRLDQICQPEGPAMCAASDPLRHSQEFY